MENDKQRHPSAVSREERFVDRRTKEKIRQHLSDPESRITEEDIRNVNTDIFRRSDEDIRPLTDDIAKKAPNPWDING